MTTDTLQHRLMCAADNLETLGNGAHDPTLTTTACAAYGKLIREAIEGAAYAGECARHLRNMIGMACPVDPTMDKALADAEAFVSALSKNTAPEHWKLPLPPEAHVTRWKGVDLDPPATTYEEAEARASRLDRMDAPEALASPQADAVNGVGNSEPPELEDHEQPRCGWNAAEEGVCNECGLTGSREPGYIPACPREPQGEDDRG